MSTDSGSLPRRDSDQANDQARFAAREFVARWARETGEISAIVTERMLFAYEMGYLRGRSEATRTAVEMFTALSQTSAASEGTALSQVSVAGAEGNELPQAGDACTEGKKDDASSE